MASAGTGTTQLAERYATALFELCDERKALDVVAEDLSSLKAAIGESEDLRRALRSPALPRDAVATALDKILADAGAREITRNMVGVVAKNGRLYALSAMVDAFLAELARRRGEVVADVTAAKKLTKAQSEALEDKLKAALGAKVSVNVAVDPSLIGGMIVKVGSRMIDSSLRTKLDKLQLAMKGVA